MHGTKPTHEKCGETLVCPKCHPVMEQTNCINIRSKGEYNGGLPNHLVIFPSYSSEGKYVSIATLLGDNFNNKEYYISHRMSVMQLAKHIADSGWHYLRDVFGFSTPIQQKAFTDLQDQLVEHLENLKKPVISEEQDGHYLTFTNFESGMRGFEYFGDQREAEQRMEELENFYTHISNRGIECGIAKIIHSTKKNWED
jgi:hypothetical protein